MAAISGRFQGCRARQGAILGLILLARAAGMAGQAVAPTVPGGPGAGDGHGVRGAGNAPDRDPPEVRERIERLFSRVICACPRENWTKTLSGALEGCADEQKNTIRDGVRKGLTDEQILAQQVTTYGTEKVLSVPDSLFASWFPYIALLALTAVVLVILDRSIRAPGKRAPEGMAGASASSAAPASAADAAVSKAHAEEDRRMEDAVERDLREIDG